MGISTLDYRIRGKTIKDIDIQDGFINMKMQNYKNQNCCAKINGTNLELSNACVFEEFPDEYGTVSGYRVSLEDFHDDNKYHDVRVQDVNFSVDKVVITGIIEGVDFEYHCLIHIYYKDDIEFQLLD